MRSKRTQLTLTSLRYGHAEIALSRIPSALDADITTSIGLCNEIV